MKKMNNNLKWFVFYQEYNSNRLIYVNVLNDDFVEEILKRVKSKNKYSKIDSFDTLKEQIKSYFVYKYWCRTEYEVIVKNWFGKDFEQKIDVYFQLEPNLDVITEYVNRELNLNFEREN